MLKLSAVFMFIICAFTLYAQNKTGIFNSQDDIGKNVKQGSAGFNEKTNEYTITGSGANIWNGNDEFHFVWKKMSGDFIVQARSKFLGKGVEEHRKIGIMIRKNTDGNSPHISAVVHGDGLTSMQYRKSAGAETEEMKMAVTGGNVLQLERHGNMYIMRAAVYGETFSTDTISTIDLGDDVYVGLFVCAHNANVLETAVFDNVSITVPYKGIAGNSTQMNLGSNLEILDITTGKRETVYSVPYSIQAPNWMPDGKHLLFNDNKGLLNRFDLSTHAVEKLNTATVMNNNNDHVISFNGKILGLSNNEKGGSVIYTVAINGGTPKRVTANAPSYLHGWSPDGKNLVFCGARNDEYDVYKISVNGGDEVRLTDSKGLDDGPEYTPDGKYIYFNSVRSGLMQIWRMKPDGSGQEQITNDEFNNWFAHISPDGKWIVFISFLKEEVEAGAHPPYKNVYIRLMPFNGGKIKTLAYVYGGQGTINTPSWSPDSKRIAFVSNSL